MLPAMTELTYADHVTAALRHIEDLALELDGADLSTPVPTCPGWDLAKLVKHTGLAHRWAAQIVTTRASERLPFKAVQLDLPEDPAALPEWLGAGADVFAEAFAEDPATPVWTWGTGGPGGTAAWWARRMVFETGVHRADAALALGREPQLDPVMACDGVSELLDNIADTVAFNPALGELRGAGESLHLHATDAPGEWTGVLGPDGVSWSAGHSKATVAVRGAAADLLLLVYNRRARTDADRFEVFGEPEVLDRWLAVATL